MSSGNQQADIVSRHGLGIDDIPYFSPGTLLVNRYEVVEFLGKGMSAAVFKCRDYMLGGLEVAIKVFSSGVSKDTVAASRLFRELLSSNEIDNEYVARMYDTFRTDDIIAIVLEYIDGGTLQDYIDANNNLSIASIKKMLLQLCTALQAIHAAGVVHRDMKPENILITKGGNLKVTDFGVARGCEVDNEVIGKAFIPVASGSRHLAERKTEQGALVGTLVYVSPEYLLEGKVDFRSDIYALGVIAYEILTRGELFPGLSDIEFLKMKVNSEPEPISNFNKSCPIELERIVFKALARDPDQRYQTAKAMHEDLEMLDLSTMKEEDESVSNLSLEEELSRVISARSVAEGDFEHKSFSFIIIFFCMFVLIAGILAVSVFILKTYF